MTPHKSLTCAYERDPAAVMYWLLEEYPQIRQQAKQEHATLWWEDKMGMHMDDLGGRSYGVKGQIPVIVGSGQRSRCSMISALTNHGRFCFRVFQDHLDSDVFIDFMSRPKRQSQRKSF